MFTKLAAIRLISFGTISQVMIRQVFSPVSRAAAMKSRLRMARVWARTTRAPHGQLRKLLTNVFLVIPALPLLIVLLGYLQDKGQWPTIIVLSGLGWPWGARVVRAQTLAIRNRDFIAAARETGETTWRIIVSEIVPNEVSLIAASFVNTALYAIGASVALAFIGVADLNKIGRAHV